MSEQDGGPGPFPHDMTLRDWFAGQALQGMLACDLYSPDKILKGECPTRVEGAGGWGEMFSATAYKYADAMLAARQKEK